SAERDHLAARLIAEDERQLRHPAVFAGADQKVEIIDADCLRFDQHLAGTGLRRRDLDELQHVAAAGAADLDGFQRMLSPLSGKSIAQAGAGVEAARYRADGIARKWDGESRQPWATLLTMALAE